MDKISEFLDELYIQEDSMANKDRGLTSDQLKKIKALGLPNQRSKVTIYRAIKYLENFPLGYLQEKEDGSNNDLSTTVSD